MAQNAESDSSPAGGGDIRWSDFGALDARGWVTPPAPGDDKYSRGVLGVMTGSPSFPGAAVLGVEGASRTGVGMVRYLGPGRATRLVMQRRPEIVTAEGRVQAWLVGSGMDAASRDDTVTAAIGEALEQGDPAVIDAGALDLVGRASGAVVITPHAGELVTLLAAHGVEVSRGEVTADPATWAVRAARLLGVTVLLKGNVTHVVSAVRGGDAGAGDVGGGVVVGECFRVTAPTTELATAGSGDVLAGILGALVATHRAQVDDDPAVLARLAATAAVLHGLAGERASGGGPLVALDIAEALPATIAELRRL
ncbi:ADP-dependent NAD(P)H-hydrate dehydratase [Subtercola boreus]|uniref:ADP-dependent (S)-NAD(P)H-hydrate dehydratase n=1 Tax=Subtercola boreus TaxID=120213 RepID=A0A3E0W9J4_9MICO|nr:ADP/ATP-dependent (S)-NAD(P)H-hydrate dehydratase [Subtercola boreus]RFA20310.1 NAD(P)H-hydrate dehydratase [Subtercola boreus]RFA20463.1 NAD(P)H-hydrate dehydratase [Subtercola boreus]RFA26713.1 NAD(P)H-hydrate dehydratase [Subtercola boreus]